MKINEITAEYVTLKIPGNGGSQEYRASVPELDDKTSKMIEKLKIALPHLCLDAVKLNGNYITINPDIDLAVSVALKDGYTEFSGCKYKPYKMPSGQVIAVVTCPNEAAKVNRRESFRVYIGEPTRCVIGLQGTLEDVILVDLSDKGVGIMFPKNSSVALRERIKLAFVFNGIEYDIQAKVIRTEETDKGIRAGAVLVHEIPGLNNILSQYQLQKRKSK